jgi:hypothetical protein
MMKFGPCFLYSLAGMHSDEVTWLTKTLHLRSGRFTKKIVDISLLVGRMLLYLSVLSLSFLSSHRVLSTT